MPFFTRKTGKNEGWNKNRWDYHFKKMQKEIPLENLNKARETLEETEEILKKFGFKINSEPLLKSTKKNLSEFNRILLDYFDFGIELYKKEKEEYNIPKILKTFFEVSVPYYPELAFKAMDMDTIKKFPKKPKLRLIIEYSISEKDRDKYEKELKKYVIESIFTFLLAKLIKVDLKENGISKKAIEKHGKIAEKLYSIVNNTDTYVTFDEHLVITKENGILSPLLTVKNIEQFLAEHDAEIMKGYVSSLYRGIKAEEGPLYAWNYCQIVMNAYYGRWLELKKLKIDREIVGFVWNVVSMYKQIIRNDSDMELLKFLHLLYKEVDETIIKTMDAGSLIVGIQEIFPFPLRHTDYYPGFLLYVGDTPASEVRRIYREMGREVPKAKIVRGDAYVYRLFGNGKRAKIEE